MPKTSPRILPDLEALARRLEELEAENAALKAAPSRDKPVTCEEQVYQGRPTLYFRGNFSPFGIGLEKAKAILQYEAQLRAFVKRHSK